MAQGEALMPTCCVCEADGVLEALGNWYCNDHLEQGLIDVAAFISRARHWDTDGTVNQLRDWLEQ
jgi:hypothetical protein